MNTKTTSRPTSVTAAPSRWQQFGAGLTSFAVAISLLTFTAVPAQASEAGDANTAATTTSTTPTENTTESGTATTTEGDDQAGVGGPLTMGDLAKRYSELAGGMLGTGALKSAGLKAGFGEAALSGFVPLNERLMTQGRGGLLNGDFAYKLNSAGFTSLNKYAESFWAQGGANGKVAATASLYATQLGGLKAPELKISDFNVPELVVPEEALMFGLVYDKTLTSALQSGVLDEVQRGVNGGQLADRFKISMAESSEKLSRELSDGLISPCHGAFLAGMSGGASGLAGKGFSPDCSSCAAGGVYMHHEMNRLLDKTFDATFYDFEDDVLDPKEFGQIAPEHIGFFLDQDPVKVPNLITGARGTSINSDQAYDCNASAQAGARSLSDLVSGTVERINPRIR